MNDLSQIGKPGQAELARRALKTLAERKLIPTPETFSDVYHELAGGRPGSVSLQALLKEILKDLVRAGRMASTDATRALELAGRFDWATVQEMIEKALARRAGVAGASWPQLTSTLLKQADLLHANWTRARKIDSVLRVIEGAADQPDVALERLGRLIESWGPALASLPGREEGAGTATQPVPASGPDGVPSLPVAQRYGSDSALEERLRGAREEADAWKQVALRALRQLEFASGAGTEAHRKLREYAAAHGERVSADDVARLVPRFTDVVGVIERQIAEQRKVHAGLQRLLALLCDNVKTLTPDEAWLAGQLEPIRALLAGPLSSVQLAQAEQSLAAVIAQQAGARRSLMEAKLALREMLATLVERIGSMSNTTGRFYEQVGTYQRQLEGANDFDTLSRVIKGLLADTQIMRADIQASRNELVEARRKVETYEARVKELERELTQVSTLVQKDALTHALNRRGLEEAFRIETARAARYGSPLALVMLDLDDFKKLNDSLGHVAGDKALVYLAQTMQVALRPTDLVARLGGEEFTILFPATDVEEATQAAVRLQKDLARRPFAFDGRPYPITFSGGSAQWRQGETLEDLIRRADAMLYQAKRSGKNKVLQAD